MRVLAVTLVLLAAALTVATGAGADVQSEFDQATSGAQTLRGRIQQADEGIRRYQPRLNDLQARLSGLQRSLGIQQAELDRVQRDLRAARARLARLKVALRLDREALARQLVAQYKEPGPNVVTVVLNARGFQDLLETSRSLSQVARRNARVTDRVGAAKRQVAAREKDLGVAERRQATQTAAVLSERDQVAAIREQILRRQSTFVRSKASAKAQLDRIERRRRVLQDKLTKLQAAAAGLPAVTGGYAAPGGSYGFFPASGTNYSVGDEPALAAKLNTLGRALHLHLIGLSGYRTPSHSVEVGGFPNDPHTRGEASDTPGVEGVPEAVLNQYGLTRPFGGAAEADHIQLA